MNEEFNEYENEDRGPMAIAAIMIISILLIAIISCCYVIAKNNDNRIIGQEEVIK